MSTISDTHLPLAAFPANWTVADLQEDLGGIPLERIRVYPYLGMATEEDALWLDDHEDCICELIAGVLVEKPMGMYESLLAMALVYSLHAYLEKNPCGVVSGPDGQLRILPDRMRVPDVAFINWSRFPGGTLPKDRVYRVAPDLAVEILSEGNTSREMEKKLAEYMEAGVRLVWYIDPRTRTATIFTGPDQKQTIDESGFLDGGEVLPGFRLRLGELIERASRGR
jgi:Uma2 family endonuclease